TVPKRSWGGKTALDALHGRGPDLVHLELSCENTTTEIPYVDLVLELLENAVALPLRVVPQLGIVAAPGTSSPGGFISLPPRQPPSAVEIREDDDLSLGDFPTRVAEALQRTALTLGDKFSATRTLHDAETRESAWTLSDGSRRWELAYRPEHLRVWQELPSGTQVHDLRTFTVSDGVRRDLERGHLHADLIKALAPEEKFPVSTLSNVAPALLPNGQEGGRVHINREVIVEFVSSIAVGRSTEPTLAAGSANFVRPATGGLA